MLFFNQKLVWKRKIGPEKRNIFIRAHNVTAGTGARFNFWTSIVRSLLTSFRPLIALWIDDPRGPDHERLGSNFARKNGISICTIMKDVKKQRKFLNYL